MTPSFQPDRASSGVGKKPCFFAAPCPTGLQDIAAAGLTADLPEPVTVHRIEEGFLMFSTTAATADLVRLPYLNNLFEIVDDFSGQPQPPLERWRNLARRLDGAIARAGSALRVRRCSGDGPPGDGPLGDGRFRLILSDGNRLVSGGAERAAVMDALARATRLRPDPHKADLEFWLIRRRSGYTCFCRRLTRRGRTEKTLRPGELRPELAHLLCRLSEPEADDIVLDPFAGSGALPLARAHYPYNMIYALDQDPEQVKGLKQSLKAGRRRKSHPIMAAKADARSLTRFETGFIHKIITDPPWGVYDTGLENRDRFYQDVLAELTRVCRPGGLLILLIGGAFSPEESAMPVDLEARYDVLVNGCKATVFKWRKR